MIFKHKTNKHRHKRLPSRESFLRRAFPYFYILFFLFLLAACNWLVDTLFPLPQDATPTPPPQDAITKYRPIDVKPCADTAISEVMVMEATAYVLEDGNGDGVTSIGKIPREGRTVAVDPDIIPYGTKLTINGESGYVAEDTGGDIRGYRLDIFMDDYSRAIKFGRRDVKVEVGSVE